MENGPYSKKPVFQVLVSYVLDCIGMLSEEEIENVRDWIQHAFGGDENWKQTLRLRLNLGETLDEDLREMWIEDQRPENALCAFVDTRTFAETVIGQYSYFRNLVHDSKLENILLFRKRPRTS